MSPDGCWSSWNSLNESIATGESVAERAAPRVPVVTISSMASSSCATEIVGMLTANADTSIRILDTAFITNPPVFVKLLVNFAYFGQI